MHNFELIVEHFVEHAPEWSIALTLGIILFTALWILFKVFSRRLLKSSSNTLKFFGAVFERVNFLFIIMAAIYFTIWFSPTPEKYTAYAKTIFMTAFWVQIGLIMLTLISLWLKAKQNSEQNGENLTMFNAIGIFLKLAAIVISILLILQTLGFNVSALIAGLGIGGIAVALAAQNILSDLFASISILFDKPFAVGDAIATGDIKGVVEQIGLKTTTLRGENGEQIICANSALLKNTIRNYKRMNDRRVVVQLGVVYELETEKLAAISVLISQAISTVESCKFERAHLKSFGDSAIIFEVVYLVLGSDFMLYMDSQEKINLAIFEIFTKNGIGFAYPTQTV
ncbi:MAG: hypothetical protein RL154_1581, partial [Pseudomonadota bacterium]